MKRIIALLLVCLFAATVFAACDTADESSAPESSQETSVEEESVMPTPDENAKIVWNDEFADSATGFGDASDVYKLSAYMNGEPETDLSKLPLGDTRYLFTGESSTRAVVLSEGYAVTLPGNDVSADFSLGKLRSKYSGSLDGKNYVLTLTYENKNPYGANEHGLIETYYKEWLTLYLESVDFLAANAIRRTRQCGVTTELLEGFTVNYYDMVINVNSKIDMPYYSIAVVRPTNLYNHFWLFVLKPDSDMHEQMDSIVASFKELTETKEGASVNNVGSYELKIPDFWNEETRAYYDKMMNSDTVELGAFYAGNSVEYKDWLEEQIGTMDYFMTYCHLGWYSSTTDMNLDLVTEQAGGNGFNGKPMLEFTYQFTKTNNALGGETPMYDILRGRYDTQFRKLAQDLKSYGHPVLFRLNNEMNTDWTSYCGMQTMLDPDVFIATWQRLYNIFIEEGVDNCIWVFNPIATSCPYSNWGDMLNYFPGEDYVQMIGLTSYQMNTGDVNNFPSFKTMYTELYDKNTPYFDNYPAVIGEFGCAAGGDYTYSYDKGAYVVPDNLETRKQLQAKWITGMFDCFMHKNDPGYEFCKNIKVAIWFSANDYATINGMNEIVNHLQLDDSMPLALRAFREGYDKLKAAREE